MSDLSRGNRARQIAFLPLTAVILLMLVLGGCGGGSSSSISTSGSGGSGGSGSSGGGSGSGGGGGSFQPRPFPGDYFTRMPSGGAGGIVSDESYDPNLKEVFATDTEVNAVEVYSTVDGHHVGEISIPGASGLSFSPDYTKLAVGTITPYVYFVDPTALHVTGQVAVPASFLATPANGAGVMPVKPCIVADGSILLGMLPPPTLTSQSYAAYWHLVRYDPATGAFTLQDPDIGGILSSPLRSLDGRYVLVEGDPDGELWLYSAAAQGYVATSSQMQNSALFLAINADGSQIASAQATSTTGTGWQVTFWGPTLQAVNHYSISSAISGNPVFSRDGKYLYLLAGSTLTALDTQTATPVGYLGISVGGLLFPSRFFDVDENNRLFGTTGQEGLMILNAANLAASPPAILPRFTTPSAEAAPVAGPLSGGTNVLFVPDASTSGDDGMDSSTEAYFGATPAPQDTVASSSGGNYLTATAPSASQPGPVSVLLTDSNNDAVFLPEAYTYGPHLLRVEPNVVSAQGGDQITIYAYGLGYTSAGGAQITIGGKPVDLTNAPFNASASANYPVQSLTVTVPAGTPGWADITLTNNVGTDTLKRGLEYLKTEATVTGGPFRFAVYDSVRNLFYLTGGSNSVAVFDPKTQTMLSPLQSSSVSASAVLEGLALTPDDSKLLVADPADESVVIFDLTNNSSTSVNVLLSTNPPSGTPGPFSVATAANNRAFVSFAPCITDPVREIDLTTLSVTARADVASTCTAYVPYPELGGSSADGSTIIFAGNSGTEPPGPEYIWRYDAASDAFTGPVIIEDGPWVGGEAAADGDGGVIALSQGTLDQQLLPLVPTPLIGELDSRLNETGSLLYSFRSYTNPDNILVWDTHNGRQLLMIDFPQTFQTVRPLAIDPSGQQILMATQSGVSYFDLSVVPLAVGTVSPAQAAVGANVQIRGSGFVSGTTVQIGGQSATCSVVDSETISCTVPNLPSGPVSMTLNNPDGQSYSFENAFTVQ